MSPPRTPSAPARSGRAATIVFWIGLALAPLAGVLIWLAHGGGALKGAAVLAVASAVIVGLSVVVRRDGEWVRAELHQTILAENEAVRAEVRAELSAVDRDATNVLYREIAALRDEVDALRENVDRPAHAGAHQQPAYQQPGYQEERTGYRSAPASHAAPDPAPVSPGRHWEQPAEPEPAHAGYQAGYHSGYRHSGYRDEPAAAGWQTPAAAEERTYRRRTETVQVSVHQTTTHMEDAAGTVGRLAGRFGTPGGRLAERINEARAARRDRDEDPLAGLRDTGTDEPWPDAFTARTEPAGNQPARPALTAHDDAPRWSDYQQQQQPEYRQPEYQQAEYQQRDHRAGEYRSAEYRSADYQGNVYGAQSAVYRSDHRSEPEPDHRAQAGREEARYEAAHYEAARYEAVRPTSPGGSGYAASASGEHRSVRWASHRAPDPADQTGDVARPAQGTGWQPATPPRPLGAAASYPDTYAADASGGWQPPQETTESWRAGSSRRY